LWFAIRTNTGALDGEPRSVRIPENCYPGDERPFTDSETMLIIEAATNRFTSFLGKTEILSMAVLKVKR
jgi:hypothetical protein